MIFFVLCATTICRHHTFFIYVYNSHLRLVQCHFCCSYNQITCLMFFFSFECYMLGQENRKLAVFGDFSENISQQIWIKIRGEKNYANRLVFPPPPPPETERRQSLGQLKQQLYSSVQFGRSQASLLVQLLYNSFIQLLCVLHPIIRTYF